MAYKTVNPYTNELVKEFPNTTDAELAEVLESAHAAYLKWKVTPLEDRLAVLGKAAQLLRDNKEHYASLLTLEMGKLTSEAIGEVELSADILDYYAEKGVELMKPTPLPVADPKEGKAFLSKESQGVLFMVEPWNFPYYQIARVVGPQLTVGNTLILKHASNVPQCAAAFDDLLKQAGAPKGVFTNIYPPHSATDTIMQSPYVRGVALTGSELAGSIVATAAAKALKKSTLELGGADPFIVLDDVDIDKAAQWAVAGRYWNGGQVCVNSKRIIVLDSIYDEFLPKFVAGVKALVAGDPTDPKTTLAPTSSQGAADDIKAQIKKAVDNGATAVAPGAPVPTQGAFVQPTVLTDVAEDNPIYHEEIFGPVAMVFRAKDEADAIRIANDSPFGLGGSVFTGDDERGVRVAKQIDTGMVFINHPTAVKADIPFGGVKHSGYGHELTTLGLGEFMNLKVIDVMDIDAPF